MENKFKSRSEQRKTGPSVGRIKYSSPSNIALVKYWGKRPVQLPANPSISFTLEHCKTVTELQFERASNFSFSVKVDGTSNSTFDSKIERFFKLIQDYLPFIASYKFQIETSNTFPHSSGIASSASGMSALALCLCRLEQQLDSEITDAEQLQKASFIARIGSGSACRSVYGGVVAWGQADSITNSSDHYGVQVTPVHSVFEDFQDTILLVDKGKKAISSSKGHELMNNHPYATARFDQANANIYNLMDVIKTGELARFIQIVESEALSLHAMMMTSNPGFMLFKPNTVEIIQRVGNIRESTGLNLCVTLDAGANVHLLYPKNEKEKVMGLIKSELVGFCENGQYICDEVGRGPKVLNEDYA